MLETRKQFNKSLLKNIKVLDEMTINNNNSKLQQSKYATFFSIRNFFHFNNLVSIVKIKLLPNIEIVITSNKIKIIQIT